MSSGSTETDRQVTWNLPLEKYVHLTYFIDGLVADRYDYCKIVGFSTKSYKSVGMVHWYEFAQLDL